MKLSTIVSTAAAVALLGFAGASVAQFNRVGTQGSAELSYVQVNAPNTSSWQGVELTAMAPLGGSTVGGQLVRFNVDAQTQFVQTHGVNSDGQNIAVFGLGTTAWLNFNFDKSPWSVAPYFRAAVQGNSGNFAAVNHHYTAYNVEPGVVVKMSNFYGLAAYQYGEGFNSDFGSTINMPKVGLGVNLTKNLALEARFEMNRGSYNFDRTIAGLVYKF